MRKGGGEGEGEEEEGAVASQPDRQLPGEVAGDTDPRRVAALVDGLISSSYTVKLFHGKWQSIRNKLEQLSSGLAAAGTDNPVLSEHLRAIATTAEETVELAHRCSDGPHGGGGGGGGGKLLLRSNLDLAASRFELHARSLAGIYASGILAHSRAIVASKPGAGAGRDDMRFYVKDLLSRLKIGDSEMRACALVSLNEILREDEKYARIVAVETAEIITLLVDFLEFGDPRVQEEAADAVSVIAGFDSYKGALVLAGVISPVIRVLEAGSELGKERAARALQKLTENSDNAWSVSAHGGVSTLLKICGDTNSSGELIGSSCAVLRNLAGVGEIRRFMLEGGVVPILLKLLRSKEEVSQIRAMEFLQAVAGEDEDAKTRVLRDGGIESLVRVLNPSSCCSSKAREMALRSIEAFCFTSINSVNALIGSGFLDRVLFFLRNGEISVQESALKAASHLCVVSEETKKVMGEAGFMPELMNLLEAKPSEVRELAAEMLSKMVSVQRNQRKFLQEEHNVNRILWLLGTAGEEKTAVTKKFLLSALMSISNSNSGRRKISASVHVKNLEKLAETDVMDAKKIVKKLSGNRFRSILNGIWS